MDTHVFNVKDYLNPAVLNSAMASIANNQALLAAGLSDGAGLVSPDTLQFSFSGLTINVVANLPFGVMFQNAPGQLTLSQAHGTLTGADTQSYSVGFASLVPTTGSVTAYLIASYRQIQQRPYQVIGPPAGHPDYNPNFVPYTAYSDIIDSIAMTASLTPPNNTTTFALGSVSLVAGQASITNISTLNWQRVIEAPGLNYNFVSANKTLAYTDAGIWQLDNAGVTFTLPNSVRNWGLQFRIINSTTTQNTTINTQSPDLIVGFPGTGPTNSVVLTPGQSITLGATDGTYYVLSNVGGIGSIGLTTSSAGLAIYGSPLTRNGNIDIEMAGILNTIGSQGYNGANTTYMAYGIVNNGYNAIQLNPGGGFYNWNNVLQLYAAWGLVCGVGWGNYLTANYDGYYGLAMGGDYGQMMYVSTGAGLTTGNGPVQVAFGQCIGNYGGAIGVNLGPMMQNYGNGIAPILGAGLGDSGNYITGYAWGWNQGNNPGYFEWPGGLITQWGYVGVGSHSQVNVGFAVRFPNALASITFGYADCGQAFNCVCWNNNNNGGFTASNGTSQGQTVYWVAWGW